MSTLSAFAEKAAKRYLQNVVFVDDEIYSKPTGKPVAISNSLPSLKSPFSKASMPAAPTGDITDKVEEVKIPYHPKQLVGSFAKHGMVCALYEPEENFESDVGSEIYNLCERADIVIFDWDLYNEDGKNILPLIGNLVNSSQSSVPHHVRLCAVYTTKPSLDQVANLIYEHLKSENLTVEPVQAESQTLQAGATRIIVLGKPNVPTRSEENKAFDVAEEDLAERVIGEFVKMHSGLLQAYALHGMSAVRRNSKKVLDNFHKEMDGAFLLHRALILSSEDAFDQLPDLLAEELLAVISDEQIDQSEMIRLSSECASAIALDTTNLKWQAKQGRREPGELTRLYLASGEEAIKEEYKFPKDNVPVEVIHQAMGCANSKSEKKLATLFSTRTRYKSKPPILSFGTVLRRTDVKDGHAEHSYAFCLMPICDSLRLKTGDAVTTSFPFWTLKSVQKGQEGRGIVISLADNNYVEVMAAGKPRDMLWLERFSANEQKVVVAIEKDNSFWFEGSSGELEWMAQLKPAHAQRIAHDIGQKFSRVGVVEAEWLRMLTG